MFSLRIVMIAQCALANVDTTLTKQENARQSAQGSHSVIASTVCAIGTYAFVGWADTNVGGESLYHKVGGKWRYIIGGGGAMHANELIGRQVPAQISHDLDAAYSAKAYGAKSNPGARKCDR